jgi:hypothetical protein
MCVHSARDPSPGWAAPGIGMTHEKNTLRFKLSHYYRRAFLDPFPQRPLYLLLAPWRTCTSERASAAVAASGRGCGGFRC